MAEHPVKPGNPASKKITQNRVRMVLTIDDHRNNEKFRLMHPDVVFEGYSKPKKKKAHKLHSVHKHSHHVKTKHIPRSSVPNGHAAAGHAAVPIGDDALHDFLHDEHEGENDSEEQSGSGDDFLFHELMNEDFDLDLDDQHFSGAYPESNGNSDGSVTHDEVDSMPAPTNLSVASLTLEPQIDSGDGIPTYVASLLFSTFGNDSEYEVRIMKQ